MLVREFEDAVGICADHREELGVGTPAGRENLLEKEPAAVDCGRADEGVLGVETTNSTRVTPSNTGRCRFTVILGGVRRPQGKILAPGANR